MIRTYEASVLSVEPRGDHQFAIVRVHGLGTITVKVRPDLPIQVGEIRKLEVEMHLGELIGQEAFSAVYR